jgi:hypothetical protein
MRIIYETLPDELMDKCDKCRTTDHRRMKMHITPALIEQGAVMFPKHAKGQLPITSTLELTICSHCLASAVNAATGWDMLKLVERYETISPRFDNAKPAKKLDSPKRKHSTSPDRKGK